MLRFLSLLSLFTLFLSCGSPAPEAATATDDTVVTATDVAAAPTAMPKDQVEHTTEANPEVIDAEKMPAPDVKPKTQSPAPKPEKKPAPKATKPGAVAAATSPAPSGPVSAPAPAPKTETLAPPSPTPTTSSAPAVQPPREAPTTEAPTTDTEEETAAKPDHSPFNALLNKYVNSAGNVNYAGLKKDEAKLDAYLKDLSANSPQSDWSRNESMAFWINAYNANTLKLILKNYPVKSITDLHGGKPWDVKWVNIGGKTYSLNNIEHDIIRPRYKDARIHFAVNCAAASCPPLPNKAFTAANLNSLLESRTKSFIRNANYNTIADGEVKVSKIFDWYGEDFGDLKKYLNKYAATEIATDADIKFKDYNWALNKQ